MWTPPNNETEVLSPTGDPAPGALITVTLTLPADETNREWKLRVMDDEDYSSGDAGRAARSLALIDADLDELEVCGSVPIPKRWGGRSIRLGFVPANGDERGFGGFNVVNVVRIP